MQKLLALGFLIVLAAALNGCGSGGSSTGGGSPSGSAQGNPDDVLKEQIKIMKDLTDAYKSDAPETRVNELRDQLVKNRKTYEQVIAGDKNKEKEVKKKHPEFLEVTGKMAGAEAAYKMKKGQP